MDGAEDAPVNSCSLTVRLLLTDRSTPLIKMVGAGMPPRASTRN